MLIISLPILFATCNNGESTSSQTLPSRQTATVMFSSIPDDIQNHENFKATIDEKGVLTVQYLSKEKEHTLLVFDGKYSKENLRKREVYFLNQNPKSYEYFDSAGERSGTAITYYENGCIKEKITYQDGTYDGVTESYYSNCRLQGKVQFLKGVADGYDSIWYENGELKEVFTYRNGLLIDTGYLYRKDGRIKTKYIFNENILVDSIVGP